MANQDSPATTVCALLCLFAVWGAIGGGLLGGASMRHCGVTLDQSKTITEQRVGTVYNSSVQEVPGLGSVINYVFNNYLTLSTVKNLRSNTTVNDTCFLTVYDGPVYSIGQANLLSINDTIGTNFQKDINECFLTPQTTSCNEAFGFTVAGIVLLSVAGLHLALFMCFLSCVAGLLCCARKNN